MGGILVCVLFGLVIFGFVMIFVPYNKYLQMVYGGAGALIFSLYLVYDTQMMMGGDHKYSISPEEYVFAGNNQQLLTILLTITRPGVTNATKPLNLKGSKGHFFRY